MSVNIKKLCTSSVKFDDKHQYKAILEAAMALTPEIFSDNSFISNGQSVTLKNLVRENQSVNFLKFWM